MSDSDQKPPGVVGVATSGIQDVSALLPLLGTEQCEGLVTSALERGLLYAAATPMSIFGSLGIVKAGFVVLWASIDSQWFPGPSLLRNAGFIPSGIGTLLVHVGDDNRHLYTAEDKLRRILAKKHIQSVDVDFRSKDFILWNIRLVGATIFLSAFAVLPYVFLILRFLPDQPFQATWLYPILRIVGCDLVAIVVQFIFQLRILEETYCRIRFMATDALFKDHGKAMPLFWDPNERSKKVLKELRLSQEDPAAIQGPAHSQPLISGGDHNDPNNRLKECIRQGLGTISSFEFPTFAIQDGDRRLSSHRDSPSDPSIAEKGLTCVPRVSAIPLPTNIVTTPLVLFTLRVALLLGLVLAVVGYIGCFSVVQASPRADSKGALVWLVCEALLAVIRTLVWATNPKWDDAKSPLTLEKVATTTEDGKDVEKKSSYGIGWMLSSATADDMHALIVGINDYNAYGASRFPNLAGCVPDAKRVASYLEDTLLVPREQIVTVYDCQATKERITEELQALSHRTSVAPDAPIIIFLASHATNEYVFDRELGARNTHILFRYRGVSGPGAEPGCGADELISYDSIVDMIGHIAENKTDNIIVVMPAPWVETASLTTHSRPTSSRSRGMEPNEGPLARTFDDAFANVGPRVDLGAEDLTFVRSDDHLKARAARPAAKKLRLPVIPEVFIGHSSHILLAGTGSTNVALEAKEGGYFTTSLLQTLKESESGALGKMTYKKLVEEINAKLATRRTPQRASCTSIYQNRLLFNGLFSRRASADGLKPVITVRYSDLEFTHDV